MVERWLSREMPAAVDLRALGPDGLSNADPGIPAALLRSLPPGLSSTWPLAGEWSGEPLGHEAPLVDVDRYPLVRNTGRTWPAEAYRGVPAAPLAIPPPVSQLRYLEKARVGANHVCMTGALRRHLTAARKQLQLQERDLVDFVFDEVHPLARQREPSFTRSLGFTASPLLRYAVGAMLTGSRPIDLNVALPPVVPPDTRRMPATIRLEEYGPHQHQQLASLLGIASLLRQLQPDPKLLRVTAYVNDVSFGVVPYERHPSKDFMLRTMQQLQERGVWDARDRPGVDFVWTFASQYKDGAAGLIEQLASGTSGEVYERRKALYFRPDAPGARQVPDICLQYPNGLPTEALLRSLAFNTPEREGRLHLGIGLQSPALESSRLLCIGQPTPRRRYQGMELTRDLPPAYLRMLAANLLAWTLDRAILEYRGFAPTSKFIANNYFNHNYGAEAVNAETGLNLMEEDQQFIRALTTFFSVLYQNHPLRGDVLNIGAGPNPYLDQVVVRHLAPNARIRVTDPAPEAREFQELRRHGMLPDNIENYIQAIGAFVNAQYPDDPPIDVEALLRDGRMLVGSEDIYNLTPDTSELLLEGFVAGSITTDEGRYADAIESKSRALKLHGVSISLEMLERQGWHSGKDEQGRLVNYPSVYLTPERILQAHHDAGLEAVAIPVHAEHASAATGLAAEAGSKYKGMALVIAWHRGAPPEDLEAALQALRDQGFHLKI